MMKSLCLLLLVLIAAPIAALAHPMGNFSINHYARIEVGRDAASIGYIIDMAEIPTYQEMSAIDADGDKNPSPDEQRLYAASKIEELKRGLSLNLNGAPATLETESSAMEFIPGAGGLATIKITARLRASFKQISLRDVNTLSYSDANYPTRAGWKEIIALASQGVSIVETSAPSEDISRGLSSYPEDTIAAPPQDVSAEVSFAIGGAGSSNAQARVESPPPGANNTPRDAFTELISRRELSFGVILASLATAFALGAFHALSPGHGKTVVAAYLIGSRGTAAHALLLGVVVTLSHTAGVFIIGVATLYASRYILPEKLYPWLGFLSGLMIAVIGFVLLLRRYANLQRGGEHHGHSHDGDDQHTHGGDGGEHHGHSHEIPEKLNFTSLVTLGVSGGIVPCPSALVVLLGAISLQKIGFGLALIVVFSFGLAAALIGIGLMMIYARRFMDGFNAEGRLARILPVASSFVITALGVIIAVESLVSGGVIQIKF
ncbi:MAG: nickel/cobalt transporter [Deltaproteobacteria bacterium]